jgi:acetyl-CoA carboxylase biotin carboxyl carrier protein
MELSEDDVLEILKLFEQSNFDFLQLQHGERKITAAKGGYRIEGGAVPADPQPVAASASTPAAAPAQAAPPAPVPADGLVPVTAPIVGTFYAAPSPADLPYVQVGSQVEIGATVGLIEVMKVFTSIKTETAGTIEQIRVRNGEFVEFGQTLILLRPA